MDFFSVQKSAVNFGLYSSNWTAMDLKLKKTILNAMTINSSHKNAAVLTPKIIVNVKMLTSVSTDTLPYRFDRIYFFIVGSFYNITASILINLTLVI